MSAWARGPEGVAHRSWRHGVRRPAWRSWVLDLEQNRVVFRRAVDAGINFIDTCDYFSAGPSEEAVGTLMRKWRRAEFVLATKAGNPMGAGPTRGLFAQASLRIRRTLAAPLRTDYIDLYQHISGTRPPNLEEMVEAFDRLVRSARCSTSASPTCRPGNSPPRCSTRAPRSGGFVSVQNHYNPIWREDERELMPLCRAEGVGLIPYSPMGRGFLCDCADARITGSASASSA